MVQGKRSDFSFSIIANSFCLFDLFTLPDFLPRSQLSPIALSSSREPTSLLRFAFSYSNPFAFISSHGWPDAEPLGKAILNFLPVGGFQGDETKQDLGIRVEGRLGA